MFALARPHGVKLAIGTVVFATLAGCTSDGGGRGSNAEGDGGLAKPSSSQSQPADVAWSTKLDVIGQPVQAGPALLVLARKGGAVELVSLDRTTGRVNFRMPAHPGGSPTGVAMSPRTTTTDAGRHLTIVRRQGLDADGPALVAVDVRTGRVVASTPWAVDDYDACSDGHDVCWSGTPSRLGGIIDSPFGPMRDIIPGNAPTRWDLESGRTSEGTLQEAALKVGDPDLYVTGKGRLAELVRLPGTRQTKWTQSVSVLVADNVESKYGWSFDHDADANVYVGSMGSAVPPRLVRRYREGKPVSLDLSTRYVTAGIDGRTGGHLWDRAGADAWCSLVRSLPETGARTLCVVSGKRIDAKGKPTSYRKLEVEIQGIDPTTGDVSWRFPLAGKDAERTYVDHRAPLAPYGVVLPSPDGPVALDQRSGALELVADDTVLLCASGPSQVTVYGATRAAGTLYAPCTGDGKPTGSPLSTFGASALGGTGEHRYVAMPGKVVAFGVG